jgi:hypothetical protein
MCRPRPATGRAQLGEPHSTLRASNGAQVAELVVQDHHGNTLKPEDTRVKKVE